MSKTKPYRIYATTDVGRLGAQRLTLDVSRVPIGPFTVIVDHAEQIAR